MRPMIPVLLLVCGAVASSSALPGVAAPLDQSGPRADAVFAGGCFWSTEAMFDKVPGVVSTTSGFAGGRTRNPNYEQVVTGGTGHLESVRVVYDPTRVTYAQLVGHLIRSIDPTDGGGQFCDRGDHYRTAIFYANEAQQRIARAELAKARPQVRVPGEMMTSIRPRGAFYAAAEHHQDYHSRNPVRYNMYRIGCGRDKRLEAVWGAPTG